MINQPGTPRASSFQDGWGVPITITKLSMKGFLMISIENLHLDICGKEILKGIGLHLQSGDIYGLLGPNGAGKSTAIFALLGLRGRSSGQIRVLGQRSR